MKAIEQAIEARALKLANSRLDDKRGSYEWALDAEITLRECAAALPALRSMPQGEPVPAKNNDVDLLLRAVFELCEATEEAPQVEPRNEHQRGFDKGRRFEAKAIRRAVGDWFQATFCGRSFMGEPVLEKPDVPHCIEGACHLCATPHTEAVRMSEAWISVDERLPEPFTDVLISPRPTDYCCEGQVDHKGQWTYSEYEAHFGNVTHKIQPRYWMPLPPPPVEQATAARLGVKWGDV